MKDLLYLKDEQLKEFIEELFISYRESFGDAKKTLEKYSLGIAHHKVIHIISINDGITISNLLKLNAIKYEKDEKDTRVKHIFLTQNGKELFDEIFTVQKKRLYEAFRNSRSDEVLNFDKVLKKIINE